jgi:uroporphyrinogen-III synthase
MKPLLVLRPEPGNAATVARAVAIGLDPIACPLFRIEPVPWSVPDAARFDHLLLTSANAVRNAGRGLDTLTSLKVVAVGDSTAAAARGAGLRVVVTGSGGVADVLDALPGARRLLHLAGADRRTVASRHAIEEVTVYRATPTDIVLPTVPLVALVHSPRAGARLAALAVDRTRIWVTAISRAAVDACGSGWAALEYTAQPDDARLLALAARLCKR